MQMHQLHVGYEGDKLSKKNSVLEAINLSLEKGKLTCLLGPNGSGKSTLLRSLAGLQNPLSGTITLEGEPITEFSGELLARKLSMVLTDRIDADYITVQDLVTLGRTPYTNWFGVLTAEDKTKIHWAMQVTNILDLATKKIAKLSDGQKQKALIARALAQDTDIIILDEPTAHLDLPNRLELMHLLHQLATETDKAILVTTHELDLAIQMSDILWLINHSHNVISGLPEELVLNGQLAAAFQKDGLQFDPTTGRFLLAKKERIHTLTISGDPLAVQWTSKAFEKRGILTLPLHNNGEISVSVNQDQTFTWNLNQGGNSLKFRSMSALLQYVFDYYKRKK